MKPFRTELTLPPAPFLERDRPIFTLGSCFAEHIGQRLLDFKWQGLNAPFGTLFHPWALSKLLRLAAAEADLDAALFVENDGAYFHHDLHSRFFAQDPAALQEKWREVAASVRAVLKLSPCVLLTLGTAWVYERKSDGQLVANCHKKPMDQFNKRLLRTDEIQAALKDIRATLPLPSPLIISLSPVRHVKDTLTGNAWSKSLLLTGIHDFLSRHDGLYFPAHEIMLDDLRDYRFYESDMIHPSGEAIDYIWEKFTATYMTEASQKFLKDWQNILNTLKHRPLRVEAPSYQKHVSAMIERLDSFSDIDCSQEKFELRSRLFS
ncbi:MAG TPA: GSCFA domain-containing protein [Oligoflexus sp.]|uniref:GSCFA domain-containing protein n=1 Tax=Oligoflexus sp. TaxID=1971216 RepID=UPI002D7E92DE|nr:GSCFA domain-containing protein [Oligoflexus sp.]HET9241066.1 GSCFA domain-containing protein [Oligoflexus sp.]